MSATRVIGIVLIAVGVVGLIMGNLSFTKETHEARIGSLELSLQEKRAVDIPLWVGIGVIVVGGAICFVPRKKNERR